MKEIKVLGVIGIIISGLGLIVCCNTDFYPSDGGFYAWLLIVSAYSLALSIVCVVKANKYSKKDTTLN